MIQKKPLMRYILFQVIAWILAYSLLAVMAMLLFRSEGKNMHLNLIANMGSAVVLGSFQGFIFGFSELVLETWFNRRLPLGINILLRVLFYCISTIAILSLFRYLVYDHIIHKLFSYYLISDNRSWRYIFYLTVIYNFVVAVVISFTVQVSKKFGPGMMLPLLSGKYQEPREEHRIFVFMDLKSSTTIAEQLGHIKYSALIRDCFWDINMEVVKFQGAIYQYVGDEVVITWKTGTLKENEMCIRFFFASVCQFKNRSEYYRNRYGLVPEFKAGAHMGAVTAVEIGETKRDIAYHGDTINTAARLQSLCNQYNESLLISGALTREIDSSRYVLNSLGALQLKGKNIPTEIISVKTIES